MVMLKSDRGQTLSLASSVAGDILCNIIFLSQGGDD